MKPRRKVLSMVGVAIIFLVLGGIFLGMLRFFARTQNASAQVIPPPTVTVSANPSTIVLGATTTITWTSENAQTCTSSGGFGSGPIPTSGAIVVQPSAVGAYVYAVYCVGAGGSASGVFTLSNNSTDLKRVTPPIGGLVPILSTGTSSYTAVLAEIQAATSTAAIDALATGAGLTVQTWHNIDLEVGSNSDTETLISNAAGSVLAAAMEWNEAFPLTTTVTTPVTGAPISGPKGATLSTIPIFMRTAAFLDGSGNGILGYLDNLITPPLACAQSVGGSTVVGNNTGQTAVCSITGSNGTANIIVYSDGAIFGVGGNGNFNFSVQNKGNDSDASFTSGLDADANAALSTILSLGGPTVLANDSSNQISVVIDESPVDNANYAPDDAGGVALDVATYQPNGTYDNYCTANLFVLNSAANTDNPFNSIYATNAITHEIGHCLGLAHTNDPSNVMNASKLSNTTLLPFNAQQIQYIKNRAARNTINVDPDTCGLRCSEGEGYVGSSPSQSDDGCFSQQDLCGSQPNTIWDDQSQECLECPVGTTADLSTGQCDSLTTCSDSQVAEGLCSIDCQANPLDPVCTAGAGNASGTYGGTVDSCSCVGSNFVCTLSNGSVTSNYDSACVAGSTGGSSSTSSCDPNDPVASPDCPVNCTTDPSDSSCSSGGSSYCAQNPADPDCEGWCENNLDDPACTGGTTVGGGDSGGDSGGSSADGGCDIGGDESGGAGLGC